MSQSAQCSAPGGSGVGACSLGDSLICPHRCPHCPLARCFKTLTGLKIHLAKVHNIRASPRKTAAGVSQTRPLSSQPVDTDSLWGLLGGMRNEVPVVRRIPRGARASVAAALKRCIDRVVSSNCEQSWRDLFTFPYRILHVNKDEKVKMSLTQKIKNNCIQLPPSQDDPSTSSVRRHRPYNIFRRVESKVGEGDLRGAGQLLFSDDAIAPDSEETLQALRCKHPPLASTAQSCVVPDFDCVKPTISPDTVLSAIMSFKAGTSAGLDGLSPQHIKDLVCLSAGDIGRELLLSIVGLVDLMLSGRVNGSVLEVLYGANLCALRKKDGGIRPIAVGMTYRRLTSKIACGRVSSSLSVRFQPLQVGFGSRGGCEAAVHAARSFLEAGGSNILLKVDVRNAFNSLDRGAMLKEAKEHIPEIYPYLWQSYGQTSRLTYGKHALQSAVGCQQGDPLGPAIFSLGIHPFISSLKSSFNLWYLDDGTLGGRPDVVLDDLKALMESFSTVGLNLNFSKCELYIPSQFSDDDRRDVVSSFRDVAPDIQLVAEESLRLLGAPLLDGSVPNFISEQIRKFRECSVRLKEIGAHYALTIIRFCLFVPKFTYVLRCAHLWKFQGLLAEVDECIRDILSSVLNLPLRDKAWAQASLPVRFGGIGVRRVSSVALPAFLASAYGCLELFNQIVGPSLGLVEVARLLEARSEWDVLCCISPTCLSSQRSWDELLCERLQRELVGSCVDLSERARLLAVSQRESGLWLNAVPSPHTGTFLDDITLSLAIGLRVGVRTVQPHQCQCGQPVDELGHHGLSCQRSAGRIPRHAALNDVIRRALASANIPAILEPNGIVRSDGRRPDGLSLIPWRQGLSLVWDATCVDTLAPSHVLSTSGQAGAAAAQAECLKSRKYVDLAGSYMFVPVGVESMGAWGPSAHLFFKDLAGRLCAASGDRRAGGFFTQRVSLAIQRGNAASLLGTMPRGDALNGFFYL